MIAIGTSVQVKTAYDIPPIFRNGPSSGVVERFIDAQTVIVIVDGKAVPYPLDQLDIV
jgi:hypothetical protein